MRTRFQFQESYYIEIVSGSIADTVNALCASKIEMGNIQSVSELCCRFEIAKHDYASVQKICTSRGDELSILKEKGVSPKIRGMGRHMILTCWMAASVILFLFLPTRILFIAVSGSNTLNHNEIVSEAKRAGLSLGCSRRKLRSEEIKNAMIQNNPNIKWVGINTKGCMATVSVQESEKNTQLDFQGACDVVAAIDGIVDSVYSSQGTNLCYTGKSVQENEVLISGTTDVGLCTILQHAEGEVYARTKRFIHGILPASHSELQMAKHPIHKYSLLFQKRSIKLWIGSGILPPGCGKIRTEYSLSLPGGFITPLAIRIDTIVPYELLQTQMPEADALSAMTQYCQSYLSSELIAGKIEAENNQLLSNAESYELQSVYHCREMIGRIRPYEIGDVYEQNN